MSTDMIATIAELDRIDGLLVSFSAILDQIDKAKVENENDLKKVCSEFYPELPKAPNVFDTLEKDPDIFRSGYVGRVRIFSICFAASLILFIYNCISDSLMAFFYAILSFFAVIIFGIAFYLSYTKYKTDKDVFEAKAERRNKYLKLIANGHVQDKAQFETDLADYYTQYQLYDHKFEECYNAYVDCHNKLVDEGQSLSEQIEAVTLLSQEYVVLAGRIRDMLQSGRADTLKEALNLAIAEQRDVEYKAQQLAEEARRTQIVEQQAYDNMLHNQRMEREAAAQTQHALDQARIAEAQLKATEEQNARLKQLLNNKNRR